MTDVWDAVADRQISNPVKARMRAAEKRMQKRLKERDDLFRQWKKWRKELKEQLLTGPWAQPAQRLVHFLECMKLEHAEDLIDMVRAGPWRQADSATKFLILGLISRDIVYLRESAGLDPFDDPLPGEEPNAFLIIKEMLSDKA